MIVTSTEEILCFLSLLVIYLSTPVSCLRAITPDNKERALDVGYLIERILFLFLCMGTYVWSMYQIQKQYGGPDYTENILIGFSLIFIVVNIGFYFIRGALKSSTLSLSAKLGLSLMVFMFAMFVSLMPLAYAIEADVSLGSYIRSFASYASMNMATIVLYISYKTFMHLFEEKPTTHPLVSLLAGFLIIVSIVAILFCGYESLECLAGKLVVGCELRIR